jgi:hypothetical protein
MMLIKLLAAKLLLLLLPVDLISNPPKEGINNGY